MKIFRDMLIFDTVRGFDSTGICFVKNADNIAEVEKELDGPENLWNLGMSKLLDFRGVAKIPKRIALGHNRAATIGKITRDNAHPFQFGTITGVHNGSLDDWYDLELDDDGKMFDVDSKALLKTIATKGIEHAWKNFLGAASLVWWDEDDGTLNFARNSERPMHLAWSEKGDILLWASEPWMITVAAQRHGLKLKTHSREVEKDGNKWTERYVTYPTKTDHHFKFKVTTNSVTLVEGKELEKKPVPVRHTVGYTVTGTTSNNNRYVPRKGEQMNKDWARNYAKAGKEHVGRVFQYERVIQCWHQDKFKPYFVGKFVDGGKERIEVYPQSYEQFEQMMGDNEYYNGFYVTTARPRIAENSLGDHWGFAISQDHVERTVHKRGTFSEVAEELSRRNDNKPDNVVHLYKSFDGIMVDEEEWRKNIKKAGGCCAWCNLGISIHEANDCEYIGKECVICPECKDDPAVQDYLGVYST